MLSMVATGAWLARSAWGLHGEPVELGESEIPSPATVSDR
jgi:hypothetical protein